MKNRLLFCSIIIPITLLHGTQGSIGNISKSVVLPLGMEGWVQIEDSSSSSSSSDSFPSLDLYDDYVHDGESEIIPSYQDFETSFNEACKEITQLRNDLKNNCEKRDLLEKEIAILRDNKDIHSKTLLEIQQYNALLRKQCSDVEVEKRKIESRFETYSKESNNRIQLLMQNLEKEALKQARLQKELNERYNAFIKYRNDKEFEIKSYQNRIEYLEQELKGYNESKALNSKRQKELEVELFNAQKIRRELSDEIAYLHVYYNDQETKSIKAYSDIVKEQKAYYIQQIAAKDEEYATKLEQLQKSHAESLQLSNLFSKDDERKLCTLLHQMIECVNQNSQKVRLNGPRREERNQREQAERSKQNLMDICQKNVGFLQRVLRLSNQSDA